MISQACVLIPNHTPHFFEGTETPFFFNNIKDTLSVPNGFFLQPFLILQPAVFLPKVAKLNVELAQAPLGRTQMYTQSNPGVSTIKETFVSHVKVIQKQIQNGVIQKAVAVRRTTLPFHSQVSFFQLIEQLKTHASHAYCTLFAGKSGVYLAASPELLLAGNPHQTLITDALAGTAPWTQKNEMGTKEKNEQEWIVTHLEEVFKKRQIPFNKEADTLHRAQNLVHYLNRFTFSLSQPHDWYPLLSLLHPTPAVGGYPKDQALELIASLENNARGWYSGFAGFVSPQYLHFSVNIRCAVIQNNHITFWAGAGITQDSDPEKEWNETEIKTQVMQQLLRPFL